MASTNPTTGSNMERLSFAKIAATGLKPPGIPTKSPNNTQNHSITSSPHEITNAASTNGDQTEQRQSTELLDLPTASDTVKESTAVGPEVLLHRAHSGSGQNGTIPAPTTLHGPNGLEENDTQASPSSDPTKPPSVDGKSVASGTTFALDEKESLRPDDSASLKAVDDEEIFSPPSSGLPGSLAGSDDGLRAFRDQLREISSMEPASLSNASQSFRQSNTRGVLYVPPSGSGVGVVPGAINAETTANASSSPDPKLLEALESPRDRIWVLKLEQDIFDFVKDPKEASLNLPQCNAYHRMLAHKIADYYMLGHLVDDSASAVRLFKTPNCRIPPPLTAITTPSTAASTPPPTAPPMKILRRGGAPIANGSTAASKAGSENGASGTEDDGKPKPPASREEREARYEAARLRIMGSAKPSESPETPKENDMSRSSSTAGKKKKKQRSDSEDGFEARSAYSAYYSQPYTSNGFTSTPYGYQQFPDPSGGNTSNHGPFNSQGNSEGPQPYPVQTNGSWQGEGYTSTEPQNWNQNQQPPYDLSGNFQRAMSLQNLSPQNPNMSSGYNPAYQQQYFGGPQQTWPQPPFPASAQPNMNYAMPQGYQNRPASSSGLPQDLRSYQYGQLPSQTFPGRPPNKLEHPLPGSYKSKHFNPQSQTFVPNHPGAGSFRPFTPQGVASPAIFSSPQSVAVPRQGATYTQSPGYGTPHQASPGPNNGQPVGQPMMHPLPQPVFPQQSSPSVPLPPKPGSTYQNHVDQPNSSILGPKPSNSPGGSSIAKWGTPASLPAKPPPSVEPFEGIKYGQQQSSPHSQSPYGGAAAGRGPNGSVATFGSMPPLTPGFVVNGSGVPNGKRT